MDTKCPYYSISLHNLLFAVALIPLIPVMILRLGLGLGLGLDKLDNCDDLRSLNRMPLCRLSQTCLPRLGLEFGLELGLELG